MALFYSLIIILNHLTLEMAAKTPNLSNGFSIEQIGLQLCRGLVFTRAPSPTMDKFTKMTQIPSLWKKAKSNIRCWKKSECIENDEIW